MHYCLHPEDTSAPVTPLFRCPEFEQRLLRPEADGEVARADSWSAITNRMFGGIKWWTPGTGYACRSQTCIGPGARLAHA